MSFTQQPQTPYESHNIQLIQQQQQPASDDDDIISEEIRPSPISSHLDRHLQMLQIVLKDHNYCVPSNYNVQQLLAAQAKVAATATAAASAALADIAPATLAQQPQQSHQLQQVMASTKNVHTMPPVGLHQMEPAAVPASMFNSTTTHVTSGNEIRNDRSYQFNV